MPAARRSRDRFVTVLGLRLRYRDWGGNGRPLVALHGAVAHAHWWDPVAPYLTRRFRVLALDWRGHGRSAWPRPPAYRSEDFAAELAGVIDALRLRDVVVAAGARTSPLSSPG
jgi:pimeloyl-ACP methyl ester carboxylesterase